MATDNGSNGRDNFTVKEMVKEIWNDVKEVKQQLEYVRQTKADRREVEHLNERMTALEAQLIAFPDRYVRREGPIIEELRQFERQVDDIKRTMVTQATVQGALDQQTTRLEIKQDRTFSRRDKLVGAALVIVVNLPSLTHFVHHL